MKSVIAALAVIGISALLFLALQPDERAAPASVQATPPVKPPERKSHGHAEVAPESQATVRNEMPEQTPHLNPKTDGLEAEPVLPVGLVEHLAVVDWEAARKDIRMSSNGFSGKQLERVRSAPMPALLPTNVALDGAVITNGNGWYAASLHLDDHNLLVSGKTRTLVAPGGELPPIPGLDSGEARVQRIHGIAELDFSAYGGVYTLTVECDAPFSDPRCTDDSYIFELARGLALTGVEQGFLPNG